MNTDIAALVLRVVLGCVFIAHGANHAFGPGGLTGTAGWFASLGMRRPKLQALNSAVIEMGAGIFLVLGLLSAPMCAALVAVCVVAGITAHRNNGFFIFRDGYEYVLVLAAVAGALPLIGPGALSFDALLGIQQYSTGIPAALGAAGVGILAASCLLALFWRPSADDGAPSDTNQTQHAS